MRCLVFFVCLLLSFQASAQLVVPLTTPDGRVGCTQGMTGIGRPPDWQAVADPDGPNGWALVEMGADPTDLRFPLCISEPAAGLIRKSWERDDFSLYGRFDGLANPAGKGNAHNCTAFGQVAYTVTS